MKMSAFALTSGFLVLSLLSCGRKPSEAAVQAQGAAQAADARVAALDQELAAIKAGQQTQAGDPGTVEHVAKSQARALDRRLADAKASAAQVHQDAASLVAMPAAQAPRTLVLEVPAGTRIQVALARELATDKDKAGDPWEGALAEAVTVDGKVAWPKGAPVRGVVTQSAPAGRLQGGQGGLGIRLASVGRDDVEAGTFLVVGDKRGERNAKFIGGTAALGALVGILTSNGHQGDHALGGAAVGAAAGTGLAASTASTVIRIPAGLVVFSLSAPEKVIRKS